MPAFRIKRDVVPGRYQTLSFEAERTGVYHLFCAEYCGAKHSGMIGSVHVLEPRAYQAWLSGASQGLTTAEAGHELFVQLRCNSCHQGGGPASRGPALENLFGHEVKLADGSTLIADEAYLRESILKPVAKVVAGYQPIMPSYDGQIGEEGILQLIAEIRSLSKADQPQAEPKQPPPEEP
jgi:cytochrome c oxidase subunit 2